MGELVAFEEIVRMRRRRVSRALHDRCRTIIAESVVAARAGLVAAPVHERPIRLSRLRKLEDLEAYADTLG